MRQTLACLFLLMGLALLTPASDAWEGSAYGQLMEADQTVEKPALNKPALHGGVEETQTLPSATPALRGAVQENKAVTSPRKGRWVLKSTTRKPALIPEHIRQAQAQLEADRLEKAKQSQSKPFSGLAETSTCSECQQLNGVIESLNAVPSFRRLDSVKGRNNRSQAPDNSFAPLQQLTQQAAAQLEPYTNPSFNNPCPINNPEYRQSLMQQSQERLNTLVNTRFPNRPLLSQP